VQPQNQHCPFIGRCLLFGFGFAGTGGLSLFRRFCRRLHLLRLGFLQARGVGLRVLGILLEQLALDRLAIDFGPAENRRRQWSRAPVEIGDYVREEYQRQAFGARPFLELRGQAIHAAVSLWQRFTLRHNPGLRRAPNLRILVQD
jgi:hypothetical protein